MIVRKWLVILLICAIAPLGFIACGGGGSSKKSPTVTVVPETGGTGTTDTGTNNGGTVIKGNDPVEDSTPLVVIIQTSGGSLPVNGEVLDPDSYNPKENPSATIVVKDEHGNIITPTVDDSGNIQIKPADGSAEGTYNVVITTGGREYEITVVVSDTNVATVTTSVSHPTGTSMVLDLTDGALNVKDGDSLTVSSEGDNGEWAVDNTVHSITVTGADGKTVNASVDKVTGDLIVTGTSNAPYTIVIETDTRTVTVTTDANGKIVSVVESGKSILADLSDGSITASGQTLDLTSKTDGSYTLASDVTIISVKAADGAVDVPTGRVVVDKATGDIYVISDKDGAIAAGPYEIKVTVDGNTYVIITDASGKVTSINPGNILLGLENGKIVFNGEVKLIFATSSDDVWTIKSDISGLSATDANGKSLTISVDSATGNIVTSASAFTDPVTIVFKRTDASGNVVTYTIVVVNGSISSYSAEITDPGSSFDFSTVTNIRISLKVVDNKTGLPIGQASISMLNDGSNLWKGFTDNGGLSIFAATVDSASKTTNVTVAKSGYTDVVCPINGIGKLIEFGKRIAMNPVETVTVKDSDGDGVADGDDEFPNDATLAKSVKGSYNLAFEDNYSYSSKVFDTSNDADFNDMVVRLTATEYIDSQNLVRKVVVNAKCVAAYSGGNSAFGIYVNGQERAVLFTAARLGSSWTTDLANVTKTFEFPNGISRSDLGVMPYDPFMIPSNRPMYRNRTVNKYVIDEVHLASVATTYGGVRSGNGTIATSAGNVTIKNFVWGLCLPVGWQWPKENTCIGVAYSKFVNWCNTAGTEDAEWYNAPASGTVTDQ